MKNSFFTPRTFAFLEQLAANNNRAWFNEHKDDYEACIREPALRLIDAIRPEIKNLSPHLTAESKKMGGALMRVYRDIRFSHDKTPYKTNIGIQFRHAVAKDPHAPKFYINISPTNSFIAAGAWRPHSSSLNKIREMISDNPNSWKKITSHKKFKQYFELSGESLKTYPRGYAKDHPMIEDLRRKDFIAIHPIDREDVLNPQLIQTLRHRYTVANDFMDYLCSALDLPY